MTFSFILSLAALMLQPPAAEVRPHTIQFHGDSRVDNYYWMRNIDDPAVLDYLEAENQYADSLMAAFQPLIEILEEEIIARIPEEDSTVPYYRNGWWYWSEYRPGLEHSLRMRRSDATGDEQVLLDANIFAEDHGYFQVEAFSVSPDNRLMAWAYDTTGGHWNTFVVQEISTGDTLEILQNVSGDIAWGAASEVIFYGLNDATGRTDRIMRRTVGCDDEVCVYREADPTFWPWVWNSLDGEWVCISTSSTLESECRLLPSRTPRDTFRTLLPRTPELEYYIEPLDDTLFIVTNLNGPNYSVMKAHASSSSTDEWSDLLPYSDSVMVEEIDLMNDRLAVTVRKDGIRQLCILHRETGQVYYPSIGEEASTVYTTSNYDPEADSLLFYYSSMTTPWSTLSYHAEGDTVRVLKMELPEEDFDPDIYATERLAATADDGTDVPVSLVYRKDMFETGANPLLVYGYGAYGASMDPSFSPSRLSLLDRGFVYAIAHVRGGSEMGRRWYHQGRVMNKMNTFTDFIQCTEYLLEEGYGDPENVFAMGESAGGLLIGAVVNLRPDLWTGVVAGVPFVDVLTTMLDPTIPLTTNEYDEWGNPAENPREYDYILSYSPVDNIRAADYPAIYAYTAINDSQVGYWEPAKWIAKIRTMNTGEAPVMLRTNMGAGHGGESGRYGWVSDLARQYAFLISLVAARG